MTKLVDFSAKPDASVYNWLTSQLNSPAYHVSSGGSVSVLKDSCLYQAEIYQRPSLDINRPDAAQPFFGITYSEAISRGLADYSQVPDKYYSGYGFIKFSDIKWQDFVVGDIPTSQNLIDGEEFPWSNSFLYDEAPFLTPSWTGASMTGGHIGGILHTGEQIYGLDRIGAEAVIGRSGSSFGVPLFLTRCPDSTDVPEGFGVAIFGDYRYEQSTYSWDVDEFGLTPYTLTQQIAKTFDGSVAIMAQYATDDQRFDMASGQCGIESVFVQQFSGQFDDYGKCIFQLGNFLNKIKSFTRDPRFMGFFCLPARTAKMTICRRGFTDILRQWMPKVKWEQKVNQNGVSFWCPTIIVHHLFWDGADTSIVSLNPTYNIDSYIQKSAWNVPTF